MDVHHLIFGRFLLEFSTCSEPVFSGKLFQKNNSVLRVPFIATFPSGQKSECFINSGKSDLLNMMKWKGLLGNGRVLMEAWENRHSEKKMSVRILLTGGKNGVKRNLLVDENGIPLSIVICGANRHDSKMIHPLLKERSAKAPEWTEQHLCLDAGYVWLEVHDTVLMAWYVPHVRPRGEDLSKKKGDPNWRHPDGKPRRWIVEVAHSWFNNFRKIQVKYEKKSKNYLALLHIAAAVICFRKIKLI